MDVPWYGIFVLGVGLLLLAAPFILGALVRRSEARAMARGDLEPTVEELMLRVFLVLSVVLMLFAPVVVIYLALWGMKLD